MHEILDEYRPDFSPGNWSTRDLHFLEAFATNPEGIVSVLRNLPAEITGALCSRASRASGSLLEVLLREYVYPIVNGDDDRLARELEDTVHFLKEHGFKNILNNQRAQAFYSKWLSQYGDDSIAQVTGTHVVVWGISQVAMKFIEDRRPLSLLHSETRLGAAWPSGRLHGNSGSSVRHIRWLASTSAAMVESQLQRKRIHSGKEGLRYSSRAFADGHRRPGGVSRECPGFRISHQPYNNSSTRGTPMVFEGNQ